MSGRTTVGFEDHALTSAGALRIAHLLAPRASAARRGRATYASSIAERRARSARLSLSPAQGLRLQAPLREPFNLPGRQTVGFEAPRLPARGSPNRPSAGAPRQRRAPRARDVCVVYRRETSAQRKALAKLPRSGSAGGPLREPIYLSGRTTVGFSEPICRRPAPAPRAKGARRTRRLSTTDERVAHGYRQANHHRHNTGASRRRRTSTTITWR